MTTISTIGLYCALREAPFVVPRDYVEQYGRRDELRRYRLHRRAIDSAPFSSLGERQKGRPAVTERRGLPLAGDWLLLRRTRSRGRKTPQ